MKLVFFGTPPFAANILETLLDSSYEVVGIVTQPDRPRGRSKKPQMPAVKEKALNLAPNIPIHQPEKASSSDFENTLKSLKADIFVVVAYGEILRENILAIPPKECINVHASLLPKFRGAAPIQRAILEGEKESGVSIMYLAKKMDAGDVILQRACPITSDMTAGELEETLCQMGQEALLVALDQIERGSAKREVQDDEKVTFAPKMNSEEGLLSPFTDSRALYLHFRGVTPKPGAYLEVDHKGVQKKLKVLEAKERQDLSGTPGTFEKIGKKELILYAKQGALSLVKVQLEGKKPALAQDFLNGITPSDLHITP